MPAYCRLELNDADYDFQLVLGNVKEMTEEIADALFDAGCDDGTPFSSQGVATVGFSREADSLEEAVRSAIADVNKAGFVVARAESTDEFGVRENRPGIGATLISPLAHFAAQTDPPVRASTTRISRDATHRQHRNRGVPARPGFFMRRRLTAAKRSQRARCSISFAALSAISAGKALDKPQHKSMPEVTPPAVTSSPSSTSASCVSFAPAAARSSKAT